MKIIQAWLIITLIWTIYSFADTIELKNGKKIDGEIVDSYGNTVVLSADNGTMTYSVNRGDIKVIERGPAKKSGDGEAGEKENIFERIIKAILLRKEGEGEQVKAEARKERLEAYRKERYRKEVASAKKAAEKKDGSRDKAEFPEEKRGFGFSGGGKGRSATPGARYGKTASDLRKMR